MSEMINRWLEVLGPDGMRRVFSVAQIGMGVVFALLMLRGMRGGRSSGFSTREADQAAKRKASGVPGSDPLAQARIQPKSPLALEGIRVQGATPHEILGIKPGATADEIQSAFRERMKQYHPDKVGRPGTREWNDAQAIAEAINRAKNELLKRSQ